VGDTKRSLRSDWRPLKAMRRYVKAKRVAVAGEHYTSHVHHAAADGDKRRTGRRGVNGVAAGANMYEFGRFQIADGFCGFGAPIEVFLA